MTQGQISVVHALPGRVRLKVAALRRNPALAGTIEARLKKVRGIQEVWASPRTGKVLVGFDPQTITQPESLQALSETLSRHFPGLDPSRLEHCLM
jgi:copper chaperone CopZ